MSGQLLHNLVLFGRLLRPLGIDATPTRMMVLARACRHLSLGRREDFKDACRTLLLTRHDQIEVFDRAFDLFWTTPGRQVRPAAGRVPGRPGALERRAVAGVSGRGRSGEWRERDRDAALHTYSEREVLRRKDFADLTASEMEAVRELLAGLSWRPEVRRTRRKIRGSGPYFDMRRTLRANLRFGGEPVRLERRKVKKKHRPLVVLCDISGSMESYSRLLLQFLYAVNRRLDHVESFVFGTRLTRITGQVRQQDVDAALKQTSASIPDWGGGTRIGAALKTFNYRWARRVLTRGAIALIISDGWDRGDVSLLEREMARLQRSCHRLIWLNPLLGSPRYQPLTRGMQAALPHIDHFLPVHNLASLEQLAGLLARLGPVPRPTRFG